MGALDELFMDLGHYVAGDGLVLGALMFILVVFIAFKTKIPLSGLVLIGVFFLGALVIYGILDILVFGAVLIIAGLIFWRAIVATGG